MARVALAFSLFNILYIETILQSYFLGVLVVSQQTPQETIYTLQKELYVFRSFI